MVQLLCGNCSVLVCIQGMAIAARSQGKHKQRIWVNISLTGIKIVDEKTGVSSCVYICKLICEIENWPLHLS